MHATKKSVTTLAARHVSLCICANRPAPKFWSDLRFLRVSFRYVFIICLARTPALSDFLLPAKDACRNIITSCRPTQETGDSA